MIKYPVLSMLFNKQNLSEEKKIERCIYCQGTDFIKKGLRKKKYEDVQVYYCNNCQRKFTAGITKHKTFPFRLILDSITLYNRMNSLEQAALKVSEKYGIKTSIQNISNWLKDFEKYLPFLRMRGFISEKYDKRECLVESKLFHGQIYDFKYHRAKTDLILNEDFKNRKFKPLQDFLELVVAECPHQIFKQSSKRASEYKDIFSLNQVKITPKVNTAVKNTNFIMQAVANNKLRHQVLQEFMLINDSVTVAVEVPVLLDKDDILHYKNSLNFDIPFNLEDEEIITGHIDFIQIRNGTVHIMDYKPSAKKAKPIGQLTLYALALSRLTSLRLYHFKCAWFDEESYFEFFPLHTVYKVKKQRKRGAFRNN
ncbi:MAG: PD-(D/E)XK nuclease family protein [Candidatus Omnitrophota bacterium]